MSKIKKITIITLLFLVVLVNSVIAAVEIVDESVTLNVDYGDFNDEDQEEITQTTEQFILNNEGAENQTVSISTTGLPAGYSSEAKEVTVLANSTQTVTYNVNVTHNEGSGEKNIGSIVIKEGDTELDSASLIQNTTSMLEFTELEVEYTTTKDKDRTDDFTDDDESEYELEKSIKHNTEVTLTFKYKNIFDDDYDNDKSDLDNIELTIEADDSDLFESDFEEDYDLDDLDANKKDEYVVTFTIDEDADSGDYVLDITLKAEDGENVEYKIEKQLTLEIEREDDDVRITKNELLPLTIKTCEANSFTIDVKIRNYGKDDQKDTTVSVYNQELEINERVENIRVDEQSDDDDTWSKMFILTLPDDIKVKSYPLDVFVYVDRDDLMDHEVVNLKVENCAAEDSGQGSETTTSDEQTQTDDSSSSTDSDETTTTQQPNESNTNVDSTTQTDVITTSAVVNSVEDPYRTEDFLIAAIVVLIVALLVLIVLFIVVLLK